LATPKTIAFFPCIFSIGLILSQTETQKNNRNAGNNGPRQLTMQTGLSRSRDEPGILQGKG
jgi:hypothetical protein